MDAHNPAVASWQTSKRASDPERAIWKAGFGNTNLSHGSERQTVRNRLFADSSVRFSVYAITDMFSTLALVSAGSFCEAREAKVV